MSDKTKARLILFAPVITGAVFTLIAVIASQFMNKLH